MLKGGGSTPPPLAPANAKSTRRWLRRATARPTPVELPVAQLLGEAIARFAPGENCAHDGRRRLRHVSPKGAKEKNLRGADREEPRAEPMAALLCRVHRPPSGRVARDRDPGANSADDDGSWVPT